MIVTGMEEKKRQPANHPPTAATSGWRLWLLFLILGLWVLQLIWLAWHLREELGNVAGRVGSIASGEAVRPQDPFYGWLLDLARVIPPQSSYLFLDNYEAGKEIRARYYLFPRRHLLLLPQTPPSRLFHFLRQNGVSYVLLRDGARPPGPGLAAALKLGAAERLAIPGPGSVYRVDLERLKRGFYD